jgi:hypothetical protein
MGELRVKGLEEGVLVLALGSVEFWFCCCLIGKREGKALNCVVFFSPVPLNLTNY